MSTLFIGYNKEWKQDVNLGSKTNQNFVYLPHRRLINILTYKCQDVGIEVIELNEAYTSKCSFLDNEEVCYQRNYKGRRVKRGMFISSGGVLINSDVNGSYNIMMKGLSYLLGKNVNRSNLKEFYGIGMLPIRPVRITAKSGYCLA